MKWQSLAIYHRIGYSCVRTIAAMNKVVIPLSLLPSQVHPAGPCTHQLQICLMMQHHAHLVIPMTMSHPQHLRALCSWMTRVQYMICPRC